MAIVNLRQELIDLKGKIDTLLNKMDHFDAENVVAEPIQEEKLRPLSNRDIAEILNDKKDKSNSLTSPIGNLSIDGAIKSPVAESKPIAANPMPVQSQKNQSNYSIQPPSFPPSNQYGGAQQMPYHGYGYQTNNPPANHHYPEQYNNQKYNGPPYPPNKNPPPTHSFYGQPPYPPKS